MGKIQERYPKLSMRQYCSWLRHRRTNIYSRRKRKPEVAKMESDTCVVEMMKKVRREHRAWGFRLIYAHLRLRDQKIGRRRAFRLYQKSRMSLHRSPKRPRIKREYLDLLPPKNINEGWAMDFLSEWIIGTPQQSVRVINVVDECSRKNLWVEAAQSINATKLSDILDKIILMRGKPKYIRW